jgi:hypothetical protein
MKPMLLKLFATLKAPRATALALLLVTSGWVLAPQAHALDKESQEALDKTKRLLTNPNERKEAIKNDEQAKAAHGKVEALGGTSQQTEKVYDISAQVMDKMVKDANGDPAKMQEMMANAQKNPEAFLKSLPAEQRQAIERLAKELEASRK